MYRQLLNLNLRWLVWQAPRLLPRSVESRKTVVAATAIENGNGVGPEVYIKILVS
jgi:hypothetical protein